MNQQPAHTIVSVIDPQPPRYTHAEVEGDRLLITTADIPSQGAGIYFRTDPNGSSIPVTELPALIERLREIADDATAASSGSGGSRAQDGGDQ